MLRGSVTKLRLLRFFPIALLAIAPACGSKNDAAPSASASETPKPKPTAKASASQAASAVKPPAPEDPFVAAVAAGKWKDPTGGDDAKLVEMDLKACFFDGYHMRLPEGTKLETLVGARACRIMLPTKDAKHPIEAVIISDELPYPVTTRESVPSVKSKPYDVADAFVYEYDTGKEKGFSGAWSGKFGERTLTCSAFNGDFDFVTWREVLELCRTITAVKK